MSKQDIEKTIMSFLSNLFTDILKKYATAKIPNPAINESILNENAWKRQTGRQDNANNWILKIGVFLIAKDTNPAYIITLKILPSHSIHITFKSNNFAIPIPIEENIYP